MISSYFHRLLIDNSLWVASSTATLKTIKYKFCFEDEGLGIPSNMFRVGVIQFPHGKYGETFGINRKINLKSLLFHENR